MSNGDRKNGVPNTITSIPLVDPHALPAEPSIGDLVKEATTQVSTLVRAEVELARAEITRDVKEGPDRQRLLHRRAGRCCSTRPSSSSLFVAELLDTWLLGGSPS